MTENGKRSKEVDDVIEDIRFLYVYHNVPISELADRFGINNQTLHSRKKREGWNLLRDSKEEEHILSRNSAIYGFKGESIDFWGKMLSKCSELADNDLEMKDFKALAETRKIAEDRKALFGKIELLEKEKENTNDVGGLLDEIIRG